MGKWGGFGFALGVAACSSFGVGLPDTVDGGRLGDAATAVAGDAATDVAVGLCSSATCDDAGPSCVYFPFTPGVCPPQWTFVCDKDTVHSCDAGRLHIGAAATLDLEARTSVSATAPSYSVHISVRIAVRAWDGGPVFAVAAAGTPLFAVSAELNPAGEPRFRWCDGAGCSTTSFDAKLDEPHLFDFRIRSTGVTATVDCQAFGTAHSVPLANQMRFDLSFGKVDGDPIDGTIDDVVIRFEEP